MVKPLQGHQRRDRLFRLGTRHQKLLELFQQHTLSNSYGVSGMAEYGMWNVEILK